MGEVHCLEARRQEMVLVDTKGTPSGRTLIHDPDQTVFTAVYELFYYSQNANSILSTLDWPIRVRLQYHDDI